MAEKNPQAIKTLHSSKSEILAYLRKVLKDGNFNYRNFGTAIEEHLSEVITQILTREKFIQTQADYKAAPGKNDFPDFELKKNGPIAIDFKVGNMNQYNTKSGRWVKVKNSENDLGTLRSWPTKIEKYGGDNIYFIFVIYLFNDKEQDIVDLQIGPFYTFIGMGAKGVLKYRKKDGNLRPRDFEAEPPVKSLDQFEKLLDQTNIVRSESIIEEHQNIIKEIKDRLK